MAKQPVRLADGGYVDNSSAAFLRPSTCGRNIAAELSEDDLGQVSGGVTPFGVIGMIWGAKKVLDWGGEVNNVVMKLYDEHEGRSFTHYRGCPPDGYANCFLTNS